MIGRARTELPTPAPLSVLLDPGEPVEMGIRVLYEPSALEALADPLAYRERSATPITSSALAARLELAPFEVVRVDGRLPDH